MRRKRMRGRRRRKKKTLTSRQLGTRSHICKGWIKQWSMDQGSGIRDQWISCRMLWIVAGTLLSEYSCYGEKAFIYGVSSVGIVNIGFTRRLGTFWYREAAAFNFILLPSLCQQWLYTRILMVVCLTQHGFSQTWPLNQISLVSAISYVCGMSPPFAILTESVTRLIPLWWPCHVLVGLMLNVNSITEVTSDKALNRNEITSLHCY